MWRKRRWTIAAVTKDQIVTFEMFWCIRYVDEASRHAERMNERNKDPGTTYVVWDRETGRPYAGY